MINLFLSYARGDGEPFVERLYHGLRARGFEVWWDRASMPSRLLTFHQEIRDAIAACGRLVLVIGPRAVASEYVRQEWQFALEADKVVTPILRLGDYPLVPGELRLMHTEDFRDDARFDFHLDNLARQLSDPGPLLGKLIAVPPLPPHYLARAERLNVVRDALRADLDRPVVISGAAARVGVHGMGGIGKSVLAAAVARDRKVREAFPDGIAWVSVGSSPDAAALQRRVHRDLGGDGAFQTEYEGKEAIKAWLADRAVLLILDDVWRRADVDWFDVLGPRCRALITTRDTGLLTALGGVHHVVELLTEDEALGLLALAAGVPRAALRGEAVQVVAECGRLPLALALCGGMVQAGMPWRDVLEALRGHELEFISDDYRSEAHHRNLWKAMEVSVRALPEEEQRRFAELAVFPNDESVPEAAVLTLWAHTGGLSCAPQARKLLVQFRQRSLVQVARPVDPSAQTVGMISLHDLLFDFATRLAAQLCGSEQALHKQMVEAYARQSPDGWQNGPNDGYFFSHLRRHLIGAGRAGELADLLHELRWLETKNEAGLTFDLTEDFRDALAALPAIDSRRKILRLLDEALRRDIHFIARHAKDYPQALFQCLWNTGWWYDSVEIRHHFEEGEWKPEEPPVASQRDRQLSALMESWRKAKEATTRGFRWLRSSRPPPVRLGTALKAVLRGHLGPVTAVEVSPDATQVVSGSCDNTIRVWNAVDGTERRCIRWPDPPKKMYGPRLLLQSLGMWVAFINMLLAPALLVCDACAGGLLQGGWWVNVLLFCWFVLPAIIFMSLPFRQVGRGGVYSVAVSCAGTRVVAAGPDTTARVWDMRTGEQLLCLRGHKEVVQCVAFSPDGRTLATASADKTVRVWDAASGAELRCLRGHRRCVYTVAFSPDGTRLISGGKRDNYHRPNLYFWDVASGNRLMEVDTGQSCVHSVAFSPDGKHAVSAGGQTISLWNVTTWEEKARMTIREDHGVATAAFSPDGKYIVSAGLRVYTSTDAEMRVWDVFSGSELMRLRGHDGNVNCATYLGDGARVVSGGQDGALVIWDLNQSTESPRLYGHRERISCVTFSSDGRYLASSSHDGSVWIWDGESGTPAQSLAGHTETAKSRSVQDVAFFPDGRKVLTGGIDGTFRVWGVMGGTQLLHVRSQDRLGVTHVRSVACSPDGRRIAAGGSFGICVWDVRERKELLRIKAKHAQPLLYTPDGQRIVYSLDNIIYISDSKNGKKILKLRGHTRGINSIFASPDGRHLVSQDYDGQMRIWDVETGVCLKKVTTRRSRATAQAVAWGLPWQAVPTELETVIESTESGKPVAWFPVTLDGQLTVSPSGRAWAGCSSEGGHLWLLILEGNV